MKLELDLIINASLILTLFFNIIYYKYKIDALFKIIDKKINEFDSMKTKLIQIEKDVEYIKKYLEDLKK